MSFFELFTIIAASATIFAFILGLFSVYNGRMTRQEISKHIAETYLNLLRGLDNLQTLVILFELEEGVDNPPQADKISRLTGRPTGCLP